MASEILVKDGSSVTWRDGGGTYAMDLTGLATNTGRVGPSHDRGATRSRRISLTLEVTFGTNPTDATSVDVYLATSPDGGTTWDGGLSAGDAALGSTDTLRQLLYVGSVILDAVTTTQQATWELELGARYLVPVIYNNNSGQSTDTTAANNVLTLIPLIDEAQ